MEYEIEIYHDEAGESPFLSWLESLPDSDQRRIRMRLTRIEAGNLGDHKSVGGGVQEFRFFFGKGYRVYFGMRGKTLVLLLTGGGKDSQSKDIKKAKTIWKDIES